MLTFNGKEYAKTATTQTHLALLRALNAAYCLPMYSVHKAVDSAETNILRFYRENPSFYAGINDDQKEAAYSYAHRQDGFEDGLGT